MICVCSLSPEKHKQVDPCASLANEPHPLSELQASDRSHLKNKESRCHLISDTQDTCIHCPLPMHTETYTKAEMNIHGVSWCWKEPPRSFNINFILQKTEQRARKKDWWAKLFPSYIDLTCYSGTPGPCWSFPGNLGSAVTASPGALSPVKARSNTYGSGRKWQHLELGKRKVTVTLLFNYCQP